MGEDHRTPLDGDGIYYKTLEEALASGEIESYRESRRADRDACRDIERAVADHTKEGKIVHGDWETALAAEYGAERLRCILAATVRSSKAGFSKSQKEWAKGVRISEDAYVNANNALARDASHDTAGFLDFVMGLDVEKAETPRGEEKTSGEAKAPGEAEAPREAAASGETKPSKDKAAEPRKAPSGDARTPRDAAAAPKDDAPKKDPPPDKDRERVSQRAAEPIGEEEEESRVEISMPRAAIIRIYDNRTAYVKMPRGRYEGYAFSVPLVYVDRAEDPMTLRLPRDFVANLKDRERRETVSAEDLAASLSSATLLDYDIVYEAGHDGNDVVTFTVPTEYLLEERDGHCRFLLPSGESVFIKSGFCRDDGAVRSLAVPGGALFRVYDADGGAGERRISAREMEAAYAAAKGDAVSGGGRTVTLEMSSAALCREYSRNVLLRLPRGELFGYSFYALRNLVTMDGDTLSLTVPEGQTFHLKNREDARRDIAAGDLAKYLSLNAGDYEKSPSAAKISVPAAALVSRRERSYLFVLPHDSSATFSLGASLVSETAEGFELNIPSTFKIEIKGTGETMSPEELKGVMEGADPGEFSRPDVSSSAWRYVTIPCEALVFRNERRMYFRMPDGPFARGAYYYPMSLVTEEGAGYRLAVPVDQVISLFGYGEGPVELNADAFLRAVQGRGAECYSAEFAEPDLAGYGVFTASREKKLRDNIPDEMKSLPRWVVVRTPWNRDKGKREKFLISPVTGKFARSNDPATWTDFETAISYGKTNGADTLAFALSGDGIVCLDMDRCLDEDGNLSPAAESALKFVPQGSYRELSVSGNGLHVFGRLSEDLDVASFSKDRKMEFYRRDHFISVTGDCEEGAKTLGDFSSADMQTFLKNNFEKRKRFVGAGKGIAGLSHMSDRDVVERASSARGGDVFRDLYRGEDLKGNRSNSDMALMNRLAFWCNGDLDQMLRIFCSSGLYRSDKSREYYEHTAMKALEGVADRYDPSRYTSSQRHAPQGSKGALGRGDEEGKGDG